MLVRPRTAHTTTARTAIAVMFAGLVVGALLNAVPLEATARAQPPGWRRTVGLPVAEALADVSRALWLDRPRAWIDDVRRSLADEVAGLPPERRPVFVPSESTPAHLWVAGDSLTDTFGPALVNLVEATGVVDARREVQYSSGLNRPVFDWGARIETELSANPADIVVFMIGANDGVPVETQAGWMGTDQPGWRDEYRRRVARTMDLLTARAATVYWVGQPITRSATLSAKVAIMNEIYRQEATAHRIRYVDAWSLFADASGGYSAYLPDAGGRPELVRRTDGVHFTAAGADRLAEAVLDTIREDWKLPAGS